MKKTLALILVCLMVLSGLVACGSKTTTQPAATEAPATTAPETKTETTTEAAPVEKEDKLVPFEKTKFLTFYCTSPGGTFYEIAATYMPLWQEYANINVTINPGGSIPNLKAVVNGEADIGFTHHTMAYLAAQGDAQFFEGKKYEGINAFAPMTPAAIQVITLGDSKINSLADLAGNNIKLGLGVAGSTGNAFFIPFLEEEYGVSLDNIVANGGSVSYVSDSEASSGLLDGQIDVFVMMGVWPKSTVQEVEYSKNGLKLLNMDDDKLTDYLSRHPEWARITIPAGSYQNQAADVNAVSAFAMIACRQDADEETIYKLTRVIWEHWDEAAAACKALGTWMLKEDILKIQEAVPVHPGALRYYKEIGLIG